jgi:uncharacterized protein (DUF1800 family)
VRRLFWRAGFGATPDEVDRWTARGRTAAIDWIVNGDGAAQLRGPGPLADGKPLDPENEWGHDGLWWLDRMVRSTRPLEEKMTLFWHDHFATSGQEAPLMLRQNRTLRDGALGSFPKLLRAVTLDPAMQQFLSLAGSNKLAPNENYARELMELFTLGRGYTETDVREAARALTGFMPVRRNGRVEGVTFDPARHDAGPKRIFGARGNFSWEDVLDLCVAHPAHAPFVVEKLWSFFVGTTIRPSTRTKLARSYRASGHQIAGLVRQILGHPHFYADIDEPGMVKSPVVYVAGVLRTTRSRVDKRSWTWLTASMGQQLFHPPSVAGWDWGAAWLSSNSMRARFIAANELTKPGGAAEVREGSVRPDLGGEAHVNAAKAAAGVPQVSPASDRALRRLYFAFANAPEAKHPSENVRRRHAEALQRALRHLLIACPDNQLH